MAVKQPFFHAARTVGNSGGRDNAEFAAWCERHGLEVVMFKGGVFRVLGDSDGGPGRTLGQAH